MKVGLCTRTIPLAILMGICANSNAQNLSDSSSATSCQNENGTVGTNECLDKSLTDVDGKLNGLYRLLLKELRAGTNLGPRLEFAAQASALVRSEQLWIKFRDAQCDLEAAHVGDGSGTSTNRLMCLLQMTNDRVHLLEGMETDVNADSCLNLEDKTDCANY